MAEMAEAAESPPPAYSETVGHSNEEKSGDVTLELDAANDPASYPPAYTGRSDKPPEYSDEPPPAYDNLIFNKFKSAKEESDNNIDYAKKIFMMAFCGTLCTGMSIAFSFGIPIASLIVGVYYLDECPRERYIPIYLVVSGCFGVLKAITVSVQACINRHKERTEGEEPKRKGNPFDGIISCFLIAWFIAGCVWVYRIHHDFQSEYPNRPDYCHGTLYLFAFWLLTATYILLALGCCCCCGITCIACCVAVKTPADIVADEEQAQPDEAA